MMKFTVQTDTNVIQTIAPGFFKKSPSGGARMSLAPPQQKAYNFLVLGVQMMKFKVQIGTNVIYNPLEFFKKAPGSRDMHLS